MLLEPRSQGEPISLLDFSRIVG
ncbi:hypothetical protein Nmel_008785 [Mimus melanotis]